MKTKGPNVEDLRLEQVKGSLTKSKIASLWTYCKISQDIQVSTPRSNDRMNRAPLGSIAVYNNHLKTGLRFPLHPFIVKIFNLYKVISVQLIQNSIQIICAFIVLCHDLWIKLRTYILCSIFMIKRDSHG